MRTERCPTELKIGGRYNWVNQPERLVYLGHNWSGNGYWHQFELVDKPGVVWCEVLSSDLWMLEETCDQTQDTAKLSKLAGADYSKLEAIVIAHHLDRRNAQREAARKLTLESEWPEVVPHPARSVGKRVAQWKTERNKR